VAATTAWTLSHAHACTIAATIPHYSWMFDDNVEIDLVYTMMMLLIPDA
jgi:hypothetical protein